MKRTISILFILSIFLCFAEETKTEEWTPEFVNLDEMKVVGIQSYMSNNLNLIGNLWERFMERAEEVEYQKFENVGVGISYGSNVISEDPEKMEYHYFHLVGYPVKKVKKLPEGICWKSVPEGLYAKFTYKGKLENLGKIYDYIFMEWLPESGYEYDTNKVDMEWYGEEFEMDSDDSKMYIYVPLVENE
ncbi:MAG: GyrI-like domain-containing protein [Candidatus Cloacimonetes bacterium]|nr:GyrI-like domain-containing protein [Candidatus Cloacimonadota bacterium]MCF7813416.1 GyrI-like domain-containing protein [Candidatus Cloacimonadota bacterium]MCF7867709.1 GyrI-like domain-containing protein [Candidatus Cloacimonadota bacterium]MCF7883205.1 GyrI-like domain-containing protein [Candidatus Cloacimonadota bacterium]